MKLLHGCVVFFFLIPLSCRAMTLLTDEELSTITSRAGINIVPDFTMNITVDTLAWGDRDGLGQGPDNPWNAETTGGYIGISNLVISNLRVRMRTDDHYNGYDAATMWKPMTIDVGTRYAGSSSQSTDDAAFLQLAPTTRMTPESPPLL
ncbi:MAG TPA: hypothetical protein PLR71_08270 [Deltaproteobacteria bacterium]|nr:hypothetical protein [Deltaproteobacteria bacterium]